MDEYCTPRLENTVSFISRALRRFLFGFPCIFAGLNYNNFFLRKSTLYPYRSKNNIYIPISKLLMLKDMVHKCC